jgi:hypothetical protein
MSFEAESNSELTVIVPAYQLHFRFLVQNKIHKQQILSDNRTGILGSNAGPCDFLPARSECCRANRSERKSEMSSSECEMSEEETFRSINRIIEYEIEYVTVTCS